MGVAQQTHYKNGFISHILWKTANYDTLVESVGKQTKETDFARYCRHLHMVELETKQGVQGNMFKSEKLFKDLINE